MLILKFLVFLNGNLESEFLLHQQAFEFTTPFLFLWSETHGESFEGKKIRSVGNVSQIVCFFFQFLFQSVSLCSAVWSETHRNPTCLSLPSARIKGLQPHTWHNSMLCKECFDSVELVFKGQVSGSWFWWHIVVISALRSLRKYSKFQARWGYMLALSKNKICKILQTWNLNVNVNVTGAFSFRKKGIVYH